MKIEKSKNNINPFGGINFVLEEIRKSGIVEIIDEILGKRAPQAIYSHSDIVLSLWGVYFCGGDCAEDINENLKTHFKNIPDMKTPNADTILLVLKTLATDKEQETSSSGAVYHININEKLNDLNIRIMKKLKLLKTRQVYDFDFDNEVLGTEKHDSKRSYKHKDGYFPGMATINNMPVYFENRDGNMHVKTGQAGLLARAYGLLAKHGIRVYRSRMDCGSYSQDIVDVVEKNSIFFYIRSMRCASMEDRLRGIDTWEKVEINHKVYEIASIEHQPFGGEKTYRVVITREPGKHGQVDMFTGDTMVYRGIMTNDLKSSDIEIVRYYNQRGAEERTIDIMNNDFGWKRMPFSFMEQNTVFLILQMACKNIYTYLICKFSKKFKHLKSNFRIKKFIFRFIIVPSKWISSGGQDILKLYTDRPYEKLTA